MVIEKKKGGRRFGNRNKKALSTVVGILIFLIITIAIMTPLSIILLSKPTAEEEQILSVSPYKVNAEQQFIDFENIIPTPSGNSLSPLSFIYTGNRSIFFVFNVNGTPPIPLSIEYLLIFNGSVWIKLGILRQGNLYKAEITNQLIYSLNITPSNVNTEYNGNPAIMIQLSTIPYQNSPNYIAAITENGNIIYPN